MTSLYETLCEQAASVAEVRDMYFGSDKQSKLASQIAEGMAATEAGKAGGELDKGQALALEGMFLNGAESYDSAAEEALGGAVKLLPEDVRVWNALGEVYWKKKEFAAAAEAFQSGLEVEDNAASLRALSMVERQLPGSAAERRAHVASSVAHAKRATAHDVTVGASWYSLGNAYLTQFFTTQAVADLADALKAYGRAQAAGYDAHPDLHFNRGHVYKYMLRYQEAYIGFRTAHALDPTWDAAAALASELAADMAAVQALMDSKAGLKDKKIKAKAASLTPLTILRDRANVELTALQVGPNPAGAVAVKVVGTVSRSNNIPQTFVVLDSAATFYTLSIYNMQVGALNIDDEVWIIDPFVCAVAFDPNAPIDASPPESPPPKGKGKEDDEEDAGSSSSPASGSPDSVEYLTIRVDKPNELWINGRSVEARGGIEAQVSLNFEANA